MNKTVLIYTTHSVCVIRYILALELEFLMEFKSRSGSQPEWEHSVFNCSCYPWFPRQPGIDVPWPSSWKRPTLSILSPVRMEKERNRRSEKFPNKHSSLQPSNQIIINSIWLRNLVSLCTSILHSLPPSRPVFTYCLFLLGLLRDGTMHGPWFLNFRLLFSFHSLFFFFSTDVPSPPPCLPSSLYE